MSKRSWIEEQCFRICSAEGVECICLKEARNKHTGSSQEDFLKEEDIIAQDHVEPEVTEGCKSEEDND